MAELTPLPTAQRPSDGGYQPISGFAVAAIVTAGIFLLVVGVVFLSAFYSRRTVMAYELLLLPAFGLGLAIAARSHVKGSEGTRSGTKLAAAAWWICILGGAGYAAYLMANEYFIGVESKNFTERFFEQLKADKTYHAFMSVVDPVQRENINPDNVESLEAQAGQMYGAFRNLDAIREFRRNLSPGDLKLEHVGSVDVGQESEGFKATHIYRMETPEGIFDLRVSLKAAEARKGGKPVWRIVNRPNIGLTIRPEKLSQYGRLVYDLEADGNSVVRIWTDPRVQRVPMRAHLFTLPGQEREKLEQAITRLTLFGGPVAANWPVSPAILPAERRKAREDAEVARIAVAGGAILTQTSAWTAFDDLYDMGFFKRPDEAPFNPEALLKLRHLWRNPQLSMANLERPLPPTVMPSEVARIYFEENRIKYVVPLDWQTNDMKSFYRAYITLVCEEPEVIRMFQESRKKGVSVPDNGELTLRDIPPRRWRIVSITTDLEAISPQVMGTATPPKGP